MSDRFVIQISSTSTTSNSEASKLLPSVRGIEVFLNFRGPDTRTGFTDHLYTRLIDAGIKAFRDENELRIGEEIDPELIEGINQSKIAIPIFSKGYAASKWCLNELAHIAECKRSKGLKVMPIFYDVKPSDVRNQTGDFSEAFALHEKFYDDETIRGWKEALKEVGKLRGWDIQSDSYRQQGKLVKEITEVIQLELKEPKKTSRGLEMAKTCFWVLLFFFCIFLFIIFFYLLDTETSLDEDMASNGWGTRQKQEKEVNLLQWLEESTAPKMILFGFVLYILLYCISLLPYKIFNRAS